MASPARADSSAPPFVARLERLRRVVGEQGLSHLLITSPKDVGYVTGFLSGDSYLLLTPLTHKAVRPVLISDFRYQEELEPVKPLVDVVIRTTPMIEALADALGIAGGGGPAAGAAGEPAGKMGIQAEHMTVALKAALGRKLGAKRLADTQGLVSRLRAIKDEAEIGLIRKACRIQEQSLEAVLPTVKVGQTEADVAAAIEAEMKRRGSSEPGFQTIVASGPASSLPHYRPGSKKIAAGKPLLIDWGAVHRGYHSDMTRVFCFAGSGGKWPAKIAEIYGVVLEAHELAAKAIAPGKTSTEIDAIARGHIAQAGFAECFGHGLGHGIGLDAHEEPRLSNMLGRTRLEAGMVVTIEPGIYLPGVGGVRLEDDYAVTSEKGGGAVRLSSMPKDMGWASL